MLCLFLYDNIILNMSYEGIFNHTDDIAIFSCYDRQEIDNICGKIYSICTEKSADIRHLSKFLSDFFEKTFEIELLMESIIFPDDKCFTTKSIKIYLHRIIRFLIERCNWSNLYKSNKMLYYYNIVMMPNILGQVLNIKSSE